MKSESRQGSHSKLFLTGCVAWLQMQYKAEGGYDMKCSNCGAECNEGEKFCVVCGQPVGEKQADSTMQSVNTGQAVGQMAGSRQDANKKKGFFSNKIVIALVVVCILAAGVVAAAVYKKSNVSDAEYYQKIEIKNRDQQAEKLEGYFDSVYGGFTKESVNKKINMKLTLSDSVKSLATLYGVNLSKLDNIEMDMAVKKEKNEYSSIIKAGGNGEGLVTLKSYYNPDTKDSYVQIPELSESYLHTSMEDLEGNKLYSLVDFEKVIPAAEDLKKVYTRYTNLVIENAKNVEKAEKKAECEAEGVSCKADLYTVTMKGEEAVSLAGDILKQLKEDSEIKSFIKNIDEEAGGEYEEELADAIEELEKEVDATDFSMVMEVMVGSGDKIIGRNITMKEDEEEVVIRIAYPRDGENFGLEAAVESQGKEIFHLHGKGTEKDGIINGDFAVDAAIQENDDALELTKNVLMVTVEDYDVSNLKAGEVSGIITYSTEALAEFANYSLRVEAEGNREESTGVVTILAGQETVAAIDVKMESGAEVESAVPSESDKVYETSDSDAMSAYQSELDVLQLLQKVQDTLGIDLSSLMSLM